MDNLVSIIIPVYKVEKYLDRCLSSIFAQTYNNLEIILIDDGSPDNSPLMCDEYARKDSRVKVIHKENGGLSDARNAALDIMRGEYCFFVDSDDFIHPKTIEYCLSLALKHNADLVQCDRELGANDYFLSEPDFLNDKPIIYNRRTISASNDNKVTIWAKLYRSTLWNDVRMPVGKLNEDDYTTWKLFYKANVILVTHFKLYYNFVNPEGICAGLRKQPNISFPIEAYHERISFFDDLQDTFQSNMSKWRYAKFLILSTGAEGLSHSQQEQLNYELKQIAKPLFFCGIVPLSHKILILSCLTFPKLTHKIVRHMRKHK